MFSDSVFFDFYTFVGDVHVSGQKEETLLYPHPDVIFMNDILLFWSTNKTHKIIKCLFSCPPGN